MKVEEFSGKLVAGAASKLCPLSKRILIMRSMFDKPLSSLAISNSGTVDKPQEASKAAGLNEASEGKIHKVGIIFSYDSRISFFSQIAYGRSLNKRIFNLFEMSI